MINHKGNKYKSKKHPVLEWIFIKYNPDRDIKKAVISFTLKDISDGYKACGIAEPASISNTILDLVRQQRSIKSRLPKSIYDLGYDLRKRTGPAPNGYNYAGEFVCIGVGKEIESWLKWPKTFDVEKVVSSSPLPDEVRTFLRCDEGALFSVIDYCDVLSDALYDKKNIIKRVQHPVKWQPNEIDGLYFGEIDKERILFPIEAKALTTHDEVNIEQLHGGFHTFSDKYGSLDIYIMPLAIKMIKNGLQIAVFQKCKAGQTHRVLVLEKTIKVAFLPKIESWQ
jgi:hypothetical protein